MFDVSMILQNVLAAHGIDLEQLISEFRVKALEAVNHVKNIDERLARIEHTCGIDTGEHVIDVPRETSEQGENA